MAQSSPIIPAEAYAKAAELESQRVDALKALYAWYAQWSEVARAVVTRRGDLVLLGMAKRRGREDGAEGPATVGSVGESARRARAGRLTECKSPDTLRKRRETHASGWEAHESRVKAHQAPLRRAAVAAQLRETSALHERPALRSARPKACRASRAAQHGHFERCMGLHAACRAEAAFAGRARLRKAHSEAAIKPRPAAPHGPSAERPQQETVGLPRKDEVAHHTDRFDGAGFAVRRFVMKV